MYPMLLGEGALEGNERKPYFNTKQGRETASLMTTKDRDILNMKKKSNRNSYLKAAATSAVGATAGAIGANLLNRKFNGVVKNAGLRGALLGGTVMGAAGLSLGENERRNNRTYNSYLKYAKKKAQKRENLNN